MTSKTAEEELMKFHIMEELERLSEVLKLLGDDIPEHLLLQKAQYNRKMRYPNRLNQVNAFIQI